MPGGVRQPAPRDGYDLRRDGLAHETSWKTGKPDCERERVPVKLPPSDLNPAAVTLKKRQSP